MDADRLRLPRAERPGDSDPIGAELAGYRQTYDELEREIRKAFDRVAAERGTDRP